MCRDGVVCEELWLMGARADRTVRVSGLAADRGLGCGLQPRSWRKIPYITYILPMINISIIKRL